MLYYIFTGSLYRGYELKLCSSPPKSKSDKGLKISAFPFPDFAKWGIFIDYFKCRKRTWIAEKEKVKSSPCHMCVPDKEVMAPTQPGQGQAGGRAGSTTVLLSASASSASWAQGAAGTAFPSPGSGWVCSELHYSCTWGAAHKNTHGSLQAGVFSFS